MKKGNKIIMGIKNIKIEQKLAIR